MKFIKLFVFILATCIASPVLAQAEIIPIRTAWLSEYEAFPAWYAHKQKWDIKNGIEIEFKQFATGKNLIDNMAASKCVIGGCGGVPAMLGILTNEIYVIGIGTDETAANVIYVKQDSPLLELVQNNSKEASMIIKGKTFLLPLQTSAHQMFSAWLKQRGVMENEVFIVDTIAEESLPAFVGGIGDAVALWSPMTYEAENLGLQRLTNGTDLGITQPTLLIANREYTNKNPEQVKSFMSAYLQAVDAIQSMDVKDAAILYQEFYQEFTNKKLESHHAEREIKDHTIFNKLEQQRILESKEDGGDMHTWLEDVIEFHGKTGALSQLQIKKLQELKTVTSDFVQ